MNLSKLYLLLFVFLLVLSWKACKKDRLDDYKIDESSVVYFPLKPGMFHEYKVRQIVFDAFNNTIDTFNLLIRDNQDTFFTDNIGRKAMRVERSFLNPISLIADSVKVFYYVVSNSHVEQVINNVRTVKMSFPVGTELVWDVNSFNKSNRFSVFYENLSDTLSVNGVSYENCVTVKRLGPNPMFEEKFWKEIYSKEIGLIWREFSNVEALNSIPTGFKEKYELLRYGYD